MSFPVCDNSRNDLNDIHTNMIRSNIELLQIDI